MVRLERHLLSVDKADSPGIYLLGRRIGIVGGKVVEPCHLVHLHSKRLQCDGER